MPLCLAFLSFPNALYVLWPRSSCRKQISPPGLLSPNTFYVIDFHFCALSQLRGCFPGDLCWALRCGSGAIAVIPRWPIIAPMLQDGTQPLHRDTPCLVCFVFCQVDQKVQYFTHFALQFPFSSPWRKQPSLSLVLCFLSGCRRPSSSGVFPEALRGKARCRSKSFPTDHLSHHTLGVH